MKRTSFTTLLVVLLLAGCTDVQEDTGGDDASTCTTTGTVEQSTDAEVEALRQAVVSFRSSLSDDLLAEASNCLEDERFYLWHNTPANDDNRDGIT